MNMFDGACALLDSSGKLSVSDFLFAFIIIILVAIETLNTV